MKEHFKINRMELSGSLGDLGTILPLAIGMVLINGMNPSAIFLCLGLYYVFSGIYFRVTMPVEPMKIVAAYAIASELSTAQIQSSSLLIAAFLFILGGTGLISYVGKLIPLAVIRGVQLSTGTLLTIKGIQLMIGTSPLQILLDAGEPFLIIQSIGPLPLGIFIGGILSLLTFFLLDNKKVPAALSVFSVGFLIGLLLHKPQTDELLDIHHSLSVLLPYGLPSLDDFSFALLVLVLPQIPMTIGNAVIANVDLSAQYFPDTGKRVTGKALCLSMAFANFFCFFWEVCQCVMEQVV